MQDIQLSDIQKRIIRHDRGHLRIVACPGSGKTEVVSRRIAELIKKGADPSKIVAFTFTQKAAEELKLRIRRILENTPGKSDFGEMYIGTIDSFCLHIIRKIRPEFQSFEILDSARRMAFIDRWYYDMGFDVMQRIRTGKWKVMRIFCTSADLVMTEGIDTSMIHTDGFAECYDRYVKKLEEKKFFDFTSIIFKLTSLLDHDKMARQYLGDSVKHVVFDEYQDVNRLQEKLLEHLSRGSDSVCVVGDDDQNIFQWRGSSIEHMMDFKKKYAKYGVTTEGLDINYRATDGLVDVAKRLIKHNNIRIEKNMEAHEKQPRVYERGDIVHHHFATDTDEFDYIRSVMTALHSTEFVDKQGSPFALSYRDMAVIVKTNEDAARIIGYFEKNGIPCVADSGSGVFDRHIVSFTVDCICYAFDCEGYTTSGVPNLDELTKNYVQITGRNGQEFADGLSKIRRQADALIAHGGWLPNLGLQEFYQRILVAMGSERDIFDDVTMYNLAVLSTAVSDFEYVYQTLRAREIAGFRWFITQFAETYYSDPSHDDPGMVDAVRILTIWKAKGLEFPAVFVPSFVSRKSPPYSECFVDDDLYDQERYAGTIEDERRAYYTAVTRSQKYLFLTGAQKREITVNSNPSKNIIAQHQFIDEMKNGRFSAMSQVKKTKTRLKPRILSEGTFPVTYSQLSVYDRCPYDYKLRHMFGFNPGVPSAYGYGTNIHNILNLVHSNYIRNKRIPTEEDLGGMFDSMFHLRFASSRQNETMKKAGKKVVSNYILLHKGGFGSILDTEKRFEFVMDKALVSGSIDLLKRINEKGDVTEVEIIDFKADKEGGVYDPDYAEQIRFYSYAARHSLGIRPAKAMVHHLDTNRKDYVDIGDEKLEKTRKGIESKVDYILDSKFDATPENTMCGVCDFRAICPHKGFDVGVDFQPADHAKRKMPARTDDSIIDTQLGPSIISAGMKNKATKIAAEITAGMIRSDAGGVYLIPSESDPDRTYRVTSTGCQCRGFKTYARIKPGTIPTCSHIEAVKMAKS